MRAVHLSLLEIKDHQESRPSVIRYLVLATWDNIVAAFLHTITTIIMILFMLVATVTPCVNADCRSRYFSSLFEPRRKKRMYGTRIITGNNKVMYISWNRGSGKVVRDTVVHELNPQ